MAVGQSMPTPESGWRRYSHQLIGYFNYYGTWNCPSRSNVSEDSSYWTGYYHYSSIIGDRMKFKFKGTKLRIILSSGPTYNYSTNVEIKIDGEIIENYSCVNNTQVKFCILYEKTELSNSVHSVEITNKMLKEIRFDCIDIDDTGELLLYHDKKYQTDLMPVMTSTTTLPFKISSSSTVYSDGLVGIFDKNINTNASFSHNNDFIIDLGESVDMDGIEIISGGSWRHSYLDIFASNNGTEYTKIHRLGLDEIPKSYGTSTMFFEKTYKFRFIKIFVSAGSDWVSFSEIRPFYVKYYNSLLKDNGEFKNIIDGKLNTIVDITQPYVSVNYSDIPSVIDQLSDTFELVNICLEDLPAEPKVKMKVKIPGQIVTPKSDIYLNSFYTINKIDLDTIGTGGIIKVAVSFDKGLSWKTYKNNQWEVVILSVDDLKLNGIDYLELKNITSQFWDVALVDKRIRFAYYIQYENEVDNISIDSLKINADMFGTWMKAIHGTDYRYEYLSNTSLSVSILTDGSYKINYGEFNVDVSSPNKGGGVISLTIPKNAFVATGNGLYRYIWTHDKNTQSMIMSANDSSSGKNLLIGYNIIDNNTVEILCEEQCDVNISIVI